MNPDMLLFVLVVSEVALRSTLSARLSLGGVDLVTAKSYDDSRLTRGGDRPRVLITDLRAADEREGGVDALRRDERWSRVVVLTQGTAPASDDPRLCYLDRASAASGIPALVCQWQAEG